MPEHWYANAPQMPEHWYANAPQLDDTPLWRAESIVAEVKGPEARQIREAQREAKLAEHLPEYAARFVAFLWNIFVPASYEPLRARTWTTPTLVRPGIVAHP